MSAIGVGFTKCHAVSPKVAMPIVPLFLGIIPSLAARYQAFNLMLPSCMQLPACNDFIRVLLDERVARGMRELQHGDPLSIHVVEERRGRDRFNGFLDIFAFLHPYLLGVL